MVNSEFLICRKMRPVWAVKAMFVVVLASIFFRCVCGANHTVGGVSGWDLESNMQDWASTESFNVGDDLGTFLHVLILFNRIIFVKTQKTVTILYN